MEETNVTQPQETSVETETTTVDTVTETETQAVPSPDDEVQENTTETEAVDGEQGNSAEDDFSLDVKYNKQNRSLNREDATRYAQMGLKFESMQPTLKKLQYLAAADGQSLESLVDSIVSGIENDKLKAFKAKADGDEEILNALIEADKRKAGKAYEDWQESERKAEEESQRDEIKVLANEFNTLQKEVPEFQGKGFESVPDEVLMIRDKNNISLFDAYLRYENANRQKAEAEKQKQDVNAMHSTGSVKGEGGNSKPKWEAELMKGIWG